MLSFRACRRLHVSTSETPQLRPSPSDPRRHHTTGPMGDNDPGMPLARLLSESGMTLPRVARLLDEMTPPDRWTALALLGRGEQRRLYELATPTIGVDHFVPVDVAAGIAVCHRGRNTLPLPRKHRFFEKRFCRPADGTARLFGYNEAPSRSWLGPGYFVAYATAGQSTWEARGGVVVDYFQVPDGAVAAGWPAVVPNGRGLQRLVYGGTRDFMRRVSLQVSIGAAFKAEKALGHYFVLCRDGGPS